MPQGIPSKAIKKWLLLKMIFEQQTVNASIVRHKYLFQSIVKLPDNMAHAMRIEAFYGHHV